MESRSTCQRTLSEVRCVPQPENCFIPRERVLNKLRMMGYSFKRQAPRVDLYKNGPDRIEVPRKDLIDERWVRAVLGQRHIPPADIDAFVRAAKKI